MKKLTIIFTTSHADTLGNSCRLEMVDYLTQHFETTIITNHKIFIESRFPDCRVYEYKTIKSIILPLISNILEWKILARTVNEVESDLIFMFDDTSPVSKWLNKPVFQYVHQYGERPVKKGLTFRIIVNKIIQSIKNKYYITSLKKSKKVFVVSKPIIELLQLNGVRNLELIPHANDLSKFQNPLITDFHSNLKSLKEEGCFIVTYTGWFDPNRCVQLMLDSMKMTVKIDKKIIFVFAGANIKYSNEIIEFCKSNKLESNCINFGIIDSSLIPGILYFSDICFSFLEDIPAHRISPPQKVIEYFASGNPVLCNKIEPHEWLVENGKTGFILDKDAKQVSDAIIQLKNDKKLYQIMSENALAESKKYDIDLIYGKMVEEIKNVTQNNDFKND